jgi:hypothetical protein
MQWSREQIIRHISVCVIICTELLKCHFPSFPMPCSRLLPIPPVVVHNLQLVPEERRFITHPGKLLLAVLHPDLILIHSISLLVDPLIRQLKHDSAYEGDGGEHEADREASRVSLGFLGVQEHVRAQNTTAVTEADVESDTHGAL